MQTVVYPPEGEQRFMARVIRHGSTFTLPPELMAQLGDETEWEVTRLGHGMYLETRIDAQQWEENRQRLEALLARRRAQSPRGGRNARGDGGDHEGHQRSPPSVCPSTPSLTVPSW